MKIQWTLNQNEDTSEESKAQTSGRVGPPEDASASSNTFYDSDTSNNGIGLIDLFGGVSSLRVALTASGYDVVMHHYVDIHGASSKVVKHWFPDAVHKGDIRPLAGNPRKCQRNMESNQSTGTNAGCAHSGMRVPMQGTIAYQPG